VCARDKNRTRQKGVRDKREQKRKTERKREKEIVGCCSYRVVGACVRVSMRESRSVCAKQKQKTCMMCVCEYVCVFVCVGVRLPLSFTVFLSLSFTVFLSLSFTVFLSLSFFVPAMVRVRGSGENLAWYNKACMCTY